MKMAAAEALYHTAQPASFSLFTIGTLNGSKAVFAITLPGLLSFLATGNFTARSRASTTCRRSTRRLRARLLHPDHPGDVLELPADDRLRHCCPR